MMSEYFVAAYNRGYAAAKAEADNAYNERNLLVRFLAKLFPSGIRRTNIPGWEPEWQNCVYIDTPEGQLSWHYHDREARIFADLPLYKKEWDGHTTEEKYARLARMHVGEFIINDFTENYR